MRAFPVWCVAPKLFDINSSYNLSVSFAWPGEAPPWTGMRLSGAVACCARHKRAPAKAPTIVVLCNIGGFLISVARRCRDNLGATGETLNEARCRGKFKLTRALRPPLPPRAGPAAPSPGARGKNHDERPPCC